MKKSILVLIAAGLLLTVATSRLLAADSSNKEITLTGMAVCGKCVLHETQECQNVLQIQKDGKTVNYYLAQNDISKAFHSNICGTAGEISKGGMKNEAVQPRALNYFCILPSEFFFSRQRRLNLTQSAYFTPVPPKMSSAEPIVRSIFPCPSSVTDSKSASEFAPPA